MENKRTVAERLHDSFRVQMEVDELISDLFEKHEPNIYESLDFSIGSDDYDNSIEIYIKNSIPYPYEPCYEIRKAIYELGFGNVYWNFLGDKRELPLNKTNGSELMRMSHDEIRNFEPRHSRNYLWIPCKYGYVDERFNEEDWNKSYNFKNK
jgi:hypothetical protein